MKTTILDPFVSRELIRRRRRLGIDRRDEVWDGVYVVSPEADNEHQFTATEMSAVFREAVGGPAVAKVFAGTNVSDRDLDWKKNYRVPDVAVFFRNNPAEDRKTHWFGGPDIAVEIISRHDRSRRKLDFYGRVGVRELLLVDRKPWALELYRLQDGALAPVGRSLPETSNLLVSTVLPVSFRLLPGAPRPTIEVTRSDGLQKWLI